MVGDFAIIAEGYTDQCVLKNVLLGFFAEAEEEPLINFEQPFLDATARTQEPQPGGWTLVLKYFEAGRFKQALQLNHYLVVHIDTDVSEEYGIAKQHGGVELTPAALIEAVVAKFRGLIGDDIYHAHGERFLFAIAVHSIECWLLPLLNAQKGGKIAGCFDAVQQECRRLGEELLTLPGGRTNTRRYVAISSGFKKKRTLLAHRGDCPGLEELLAQLEARAIVIPVAE